MRVMVASSPPGWLTAPAVPGRVAAFSVPAPTLGAAVAVRTWSPGDADDGEPLPLIVAHDGPEYDAQAQLTRYLAAGVTSGRLPRLRAALLAPGSPGQMRRDQWYSASASYTSALALTVLPALAARVAVTARIGMGASLGALAMLHAHCRCPATFDALFLQSGSFFCPRFDSQEQGFRYYRRVVRFVAGVHGGRLPARQIPVVLTCGQQEENVHNNRLMAACLHARGYPGGLYEVPGLHNFTAWRDAFDPYLTCLLRQVMRESR